MAERMGKTVQEGQGGFIHLHVHSNYSLSRGASTLEDLLERARALGMRALALTDTNALYGALYFYKAARKMGIKPIIGAVLDEPEDPDRYAVLLARDRAGYSQLCRAVTYRQLMDKRRLSRRLTGHSSPCDEPREPGRTAESGGATFSLTDCIREHQEGLFVLTPEQPGTKLLLNEAPTRARSYRPHGRPTSPHWRYAFAPPPGKEFATIEFACDIEQLQPRYGGAFSCYVPTGGEAHALRHLASAGWPSDKPPGRGIVRRRVDVPPGVRAVHIKTGSWQGHFHVHSVEVKATFRPAARNVKLPRLRPQAWVQTEALPAGGRLTYGRKELSPGSAYSDFEPGKYRLRYEVPGRAAKFEADFVVEPGGRYGIFANLDSPFRWRQTAIRDLGRHPAARASIARLPDGSYLAVWCGVGSKLMVSRSRDLVTWAKGERLPFSSIFADVSPAILTARNGTVYLAYFSQRLYLLDLSTAGYQLWVTSTRDGRKWSFLKPIPIAGAVDGWPIGAVQMLEGPDGRARIYWRHYAAVGKSIAEAPQLSPTNVIGGRPGIHPWNPHVSVDARGLYHLVFGDFGQGIYHTTSKDGLDWAVPAALVQGGRAANPQLIHARGRALLLCERNDGAYLAPTQLDRRPGRVGRAVKITNHVVPLAGARVAMTPDGEAVLLAGGNTTWLLRAKLKALTALRAHK